MLVAADGDVLIDLATRSGPVAALLLVILWGGFREKPWWVFGWVYRDLEKRYEQRGEQLDKRAELIDQWWQTASKATATAEILAGKPPDEKHEGGR